MDDNKLRELDERIIDEMESSIGCLAMFRPEHRFEYARSLIAAVDAERGEPVIHYEEHPDGAITQVQPEDMRACRLCDCSGDIHSPDGEWRGQCPYCQPARDPAISLAAVMQPYTSEALHRANFEQLLTTLVEMLAEMDKARDPAPLVEALRRILTGPIYEADKTAREALAAWEAK